MQSQKRSRILWQTAGLGLIIVFLVGLGVLFVDVDAVWRELRQAKPGYVLASSLFLLLGLVIFAVRWRFLLQNKPSLMHTFHASNIGHAGNILLTARVGEPMRIVVMGQDGSVSYTAATSSFVVERLFETMMRLLALSTAVIFGSNIEITPGTVLVGLLFILFMFGLIFWLVNNREKTLKRGTAVLSRLPRVKSETAHHWLTDLLDNLQYVATLPRMGQAMGWSLLMWLCFWGFFYVLLLALGDRVPAQDRLAISLGALALSPPSAPTQPGLFHGSVVIPLTAVGFDEVALVAYAILLHVVEMFWVILLAIWGLVRTGISVSSVMGKTVKSEK